MTQKDSSGNTQRKHVKYSIPLIEKSPPGCKLGKVDMMRGYMKEDIGYSTILLSRVMGFPASRHLNIWRVHFIKTIKITKMPIDWASILSKKLYEHLVMVKNNCKFQITSYLVYLLATRAIDYLGLLKKGNMQDANAWPYIVYPQLVKKKIPEHSKEYIIVNDPFI